jgi:hypothetical protein
MELCYDWDVLQYPWSLTMSFVILQLQLETITTPGSTTTRIESQCLTSAHEATIEQDYGTEESPPPHWMTGWRRRGTSRD